jgi:hypothetical protein
VRHALAKFAFNAAAFFFAHSIQTLERITGSSHYSGLERIIGRITCRIESSRNAEDNVEIGLSGDGELSGCSPECGDISRNQRTIQRESFVIPPLQIKRDLDMAARNLLFEQPPKLHFERIGAGRQPKMEIEKAVVHRFQREREGEVTVALGGGERARCRAGCGSRSVRDLTFDLRKARHGTNRHE